MKIKNSLSFQSLLVAITLLSLGLFTVSCDPKNEDTPLAVTSFTPTSGGAGTVVTIVGTGFDGTTAGNVVKFGTVTATVQAASATLLVVTVPSGVTGNQTISVTKGGATANSTTQFNAVGPPVLGIASFSPATGGYGTVVTITGTAFDPTPANNIVKFGTTTATVASANATSLVVTVPTGAANGNQKVSVQVGANTVTSTGDFNVTAFPEVAVKDSVNAGGTATTINWTADKRYILNGFVYVPKGVTLNIAAGTIIKGGNITAALVVEPGAILNAVGTAALPIVFTSNLPAGSRGYGDWGGVLIAGDARVNIATASTRPQAEGGIRTRYGSNTDAQNAQNSGTIRYVRIEFSGYAVAPNSELNGLTLAGVGSGTTIDHVQVSFINDDGFEWFGGTANAKYLISHRSWDDDFDTDNGFSGNLQFGIGTRDLTAADQSGSKSFESDNSGTGSPWAELPLTAAVFSNFTVVGPLTGTGNPSLTGLNANYVTALHLRRNTSISLFNSIVVGWPSGLLIDFVNTATNAKNGNLKVVNNVFGGIRRDAVTNSNTTRKEVLYIGTAGAGSLTPTNTVNGDTTTAFTADPLTAGPNNWFTANSNRRVDDGTSVLESPFTASGPSITTPNFAIKTTFSAPAAAFGDAKVSGAFFDKVTFVGAIGTGTTWNLDQAWVNWNPNATTY